MKSKIYLADVSPNCYITQSERVIINWLVKGKNHEEISIIKGKSISTIRNQIQTLKKRMNCTTQEQLIYVISKSIFSDQVFYI